MATEIIEQLVSSKFKFKCDEDGIGWYILAGWLGREDWAAVKRHFSYLRDDVFIQGWVTDKPKVVAEILVSRGVWKSVDE